jgi:hypothetical protein
MESRRVTAVEVNSRGYVTRLRNDGADWSPQAARDVVIDLELGAAAYHVEWAGEHLPVVVAQDAGGCYLTTHGKAAGVNRLLQLAAEFSAR